MLTFLSVRPCCISDRWFRLDCRIWSARKVKETTTAKPETNDPSAARSDNDMANPLRMSPCGHSTPALAPEIDTSSRQHRSEEAVGGGYERRGFEETVHARRRRCA